MPYLFLRAIRTVLMSTSPFIRLPPPSNFNPFYCVSYRKQTKTLQTDHWIEAKLMLNFKHEGYRAALGPTHCANLAILPNVLQSHVCHSRNGHRLWSEEVSRPSLTMLLVGYPITDNKFNAWVFQGEGHCTRYVQDSYVFGVFLLRYLSHIKMIFLSCYQWWLAIHAIFYAPSVLNTASSCGNHPLGIMDCKHVKGLTNDAMKQRHIS